MGTTGQLASSPVTLDAAIIAACEQPGTVLLESNRDGSDHAECFLFADPLSELIAWRPEEIDSVLAGIEAARVRGQWAAGWMSYEAGQCFEPAAERSHDTQYGWPLAWFGIYAEPQRVKRSQDAAASEPPGISPVQLNLCKEQYSEQIDAIRAWITDGDIYQLNLTAEAHFHLENAEPQTIARLYHQLRQRQRVDYAALIHWRSGSRILSLSPELFFSIDAERNITTRPMKGTAPRGLDGDGDRAQAAWLAADKKNRAENVMIVDLLRNDLGRLCKFGSVAVSDIFQPERYETLWQMTSTVRGKLRNSTQVQDVFRALFPCGSITGAPKVRAMQLITELERRPRGIYTGSIGYWGPTQATMSVAIRTLALENAEGRLGIGSGIVIDSDAESEWQECHLKAAFLTDRTSFPSLIESFLWQDGYPLKPLHLERLADSADYLGIVLRMDAVEQALADAVTTARPHQRYKVRLLVSPSGNATAEVAEIVDVHTPLRVLLSNIRIDSNSRLLRHKTTTRTLFDTELARARTLGFDEIIFQNERGEITEGAISNIFAELNGKLVTPPTACGLLPGVYRKHLLTTVAHAEERMLTPDDLRKAERLYLTNAVRGIREMMLPSAE